MSDPRPVQRMPRTDPDAVFALRGPLAARCRRALSGAHGIALPPLIDHHVHLHLIDEHALAAHGIAAVVDLGGDPVVLKRRLVGALPRAMYAGAFLTAAGGYPVGRAWAPLQISREVLDPSLRPGVRAGAATAVDEQAEFGASVIKVALNADAGPVFGPALLQAIVDAAHVRGLPVVAHAEGEGMVEAALDAGVDALAHTPFTGVLPDAVIERAASSQTWISTLAIHTTPARDTAIANLRRFCVAGGRVLYGTDLGNGDLPLGVNVDELFALQEAGIRGAEMVEAMTDPWPATARGTLAGAVATFVPGEPPTAAEDVPRWLERAIVVPAEELVRIDR